MKMARFGASNNMSALEKIREANQNLNTRLFYTNKERNVSSDFTEEQLDQLVTDGYLQQVAQTVCDEGHNIWAGTLEECKEHVQDSCPECDGYDCDTDEDYRILIRYHLIKDFDKNDPVDPNHWFAKLYVHW